ncbi:MAG: ROK family protein [Phycisphaerae bacterium]|jgi:glucokinase
MATSCTIGLDLGGTNIKGGLCGRDGTLRAMRSVDTEADRGFDHVMGRMAGVVDTLLDEAGLSREDIHAVGVGSPGPLSHKDGIIYRAPNLPGWINIPLRDLFSAAIHLPVVLENDGNAAAFGEYLAGAGRNAGSMVMLTLGTGIGGGIVLDGKLWRGVDDAAAEIGHIVVVPGGRLCPCGQAGCFERYGSANAVGERLIEALAAGEPSSLAAVHGAGQPLDARHVLQAADAGDALATRIWDETCYYLALGCISVEHTLSPNLIVLAGGLTHAGARLLEPVREQYLRLRWRISTRPPEITLAKLGPEAGTIGAAALAWEG